MLSNFQWLEQLSRKKKIKKEHNSIIDGDRIAFLCVVIGGKQICIDASDIAEVVAREQISLVGHTVSWFKGLIKAQGDIYSLVDISPFLDASPVSVKKGYIVTLSRRYDNIAIVVDMLGGLRSVQKMEKIEETEYTDIYRVGDERITMLSCQRLLSSEKFFDISLY